MTYRDEEVRFGRVEEDELHGALDFLERCLGVPPRDLVHPYARLALRWVCGTDIVSSVYAKTSGAHGTLYTYTLKRGSRPCDAIRAASAVPVMKGD